MTNNNSKTDDVADRPVLCVGPQLELRNAMAVRADIATRAVAADLIVDLSGVTECDLAGLQILVALRASAEKRQGKCSFQAPSAVVRRACATYGIDLLSEEASS